MRFFNDLNPEIRNTLIATIPAAMVSTHAAAYSTLASFATGCDLAYEETMLQAVTQTLALTAALLKIDQITDRRYEKKLTYFALAAFNAILIKTMHNMGTFACLSDAIADESVEPVASDAYSHSL